MMEIAVTAHSSNPNINEYDSQKHYTSPPLLLPSPKVGTLFAFTRRVVGRVDPVTADQIRVLQFVPKAVVHNECGLSVCAVA